MVGGYTLCVCVCVQYSSCVDILALSPASSSSSVWWGVDCSTPFLLFPSPPAVMVGDCNIVVVLMYNIFPLLDYIVQR